MRDREAAERRVRQIRAWQAELDALRSAGVLQLTDEQRAIVGTYHDQLLTRLATQHDADLTEAARRLSRGMQVASFVAAVALTAALYSLVAQYWARFELPLQATLLAAFPLMALVGVELSARRERTLSVSSLCALVAYGTFWLAVSVLSQTLNVAVSPPWIWAGVLFGFALALAYRFRLILAASLLALLVAVSGSIFQAVGHPWTLMAERLDVVTVAAFSLTTLSKRLGQLQRQFATITRLVGFGVGLGGLLIMSTAGVTSLLPMTARAAALLYQVVMLVASVALIAVAIRRRWHETMYLAGALLTLFLVLRFVDWFWEAVPAYAFFLILSAGALAWLLALRRLRAKLVHRPVAG